MEFIYKCTKCNYLGRVSGEGGGINYYPLKWDCLECHAPITSESIFFNEKNSTEFMKMKKNLNDKL
jgi:hypothetical protein